MWRVLSPFQRTRFFNTYSEEWMLDAICLIAEEFGTLLSMDIPMMHLQYLHSRAFNLREDRAKTAANLQKR